MNRLALSLLALIAATQCVAQEGPVLRTEFDQSQGIPGQPLSLRLTLLVPTYMPKPPVWPSFESPNLMVRLPERASGPVSERIGGETWSGITRHYRLYPMVAGTFDIPAQPVKVVYADPDNQQPVTTTLETEPLQFTGQIPDAATELSPFLAATDVNIEQTLDGKPEQLKPGKSLVWTVTARIEGTSPMFLPELMPKLSLEGLAAYPEEPVVSETIDRGVLSGTRQERITFVAEAGGTGELPALTIRWFDLENQSVETASVESRPYNVDAPPLGALPSRDWRQVALVVITGVVVVGIIYWLGRRLAAPVRRLLARRKAEWLASERHAFRQLSRAIANRNLRMLYPALNHWARFFPGRDPMQQGEIEQTLLKIAGQHYGKSGSAAGDDHWRDLEKQLRQARRQLRHPSTTAQDLPPINPIAPTGPAG